SCTMKFLLIFVPQAVGKMTVGDELSKATGLRLFHNHMTIELLDPLFDFSPEMWQLSTLFRTEIFKTIAESEQEGLIFTYVWAFDQSGDWNLVDQTCEVFATKGTMLYIVELEADTDKRLKRNRSPHRLEQKPTKRNVDWSEKELLKTMKDYRLNSHTGEIKHENYIRINNTNLTPKEVVELIIDQFDL